MLGVPRPRHGLDQRWIDNYYGTVIARNARFGGEGGGFTVLVNRASFLRTPVPAKGAPPWVPGPYTPPPGHGPLPNGTVWWPDPQASAAIFEDCQVDAYGNTVRNASIWLDELPATLALRRCLGFAYDPRWGPSSEQKLLAVNASLDLDGPQLDLAAGRLHWEIGDANTWAPRGHYSSLPQQLWPYLVDPVRAYDGDKPREGPPTKGVWQAGQIVLPALNSSIAGGGWRCTRGGKPGEWKAIE